MTQKSSHSAPLPFLNKIERSDAVTSFIYLTVVLLFFFKLSKNLYWTAGIDNFLDNIKWMIDFYPSPYILWKILWKFVCPLLYLVRVRIIFLFLRGKEFHAFLKKSVALAIWITTVYGPRFFFK